MNASKSNKPNTKTFKDCNAPNSCSAPMSPTSPHHAHEHPYHTSMNMFMDSSKLSSTNTPRDNYYP